MVKYNIIGDFLLWQEKKTVHRVNDRRITKHHPSASSELFFFLFFHNYSTYNYRCKKDND